MRDTASSLPQPDDGYFRALIENGVDIVIVLDEQGRVRYQSPAAERIVGYPPEKTLGTSGFDFVHPDDLPLVLDRFAETTKTPGMTPGLAVRIRQPNGTWRTLEVVANNLLDDERIAGILINCRDTLFPRLGAGTDFPYVKPVGQPQGHQDQPDQPDQPDQQDQTRSASAFLREHGRSGTHQAQAMSPPSLIGQTKVMRELLRQARIVAGSTSSVLLQGESGTGKELLARVIHAQSSWGVRPFVPIDCSTLSEELFERAFLGHTMELPPFASPDKTGLLAAAYGGTVFLDDIGNLPPRLQARLLRFFQDRGLIGSQLSRPARPARPARPIAVRIIASTQHDLRQAIQAGRFRKDLYYHLAVVRLVVPPLSHRRKDIPLLAEHFLQHYCAQIGVAKKRIPHQTMQLLINAPWPGNVRELMSTMERLALFSPGLEIGPEIRTESLQPELVDPMFPASEEATSPHEGDQARAVLERIERDKLRAALLQAGNNRTEAAKLLGVSRATFYVKAKRYSLFLQEK